MGQRSVLHQHCPHTSSILAGKHTLWLSSLSYQCLSVLQWKVPILSSLSSQSR